jgi:hypothetical protein
MDVVEKFMTWAVGHGDLVLAFVSLVAAATSIAAGRYRAEARAASAGLETVGRAIEDVSKSLAGEGALAVKQAVRERQTGDAKKAIEKMVLRIGGKNGQGKK